MKTGDDFRKQVKLHGITKWPSHPCSICNVWVGYEFHDGAPYYNSSCGCSGGSALQVRTWDDVAEMYNMQVTPSVIEKMDKFWHFEPIKAD